MIGFLALTVILIWSQIRGYQRQDRGQFVQATVLAFIGAIAILYMTLILKDWL